MSLDALTITLLDGLDITELDGLVLEGAGGDVTDPTLSSPSIAVNGTDLVLLFDETVTSDYTGFTLSGKTLTTASGSGSGTNTLTIPIASTVQAGESLTLDYDDTVGNVADGSSNALASFTGRAVTNNSTQDTVAPTLNAATFIEGGTKVRLRISEPVTGTLGWSFDAGTFTHESGDGTNTHILAITSGSPTTISYDQGTGNVVDGAGNELETVTNQAISRGGISSIPIGLPL